VNKLLLTISIFLLGGSVTAQQIDVPVVNLQSGYYTTDVNIEVSVSEPGTTIFYTLNGSEPTPANSIYTGPITLSNRTGDPNNYSMIETNPSFFFPIGNYTESRANNRGWLPPLNEVYKVNVIRFKAYKAGFVPSETVTRTIIVDPSGANLYNYPVVSFVMDSIDIFSDGTGIYHYGDHPMGNYFQKGPLWERLAHMEYFDKDGQLQIQQMVRTRIHGGGSRQSTKKTFRVYAEYDTVNNFKYPFFDNYQLKKYKRILIRSGGHRPDCFPRDDLANSITEGLHGDQQHYKHIILFVNGEYWGIHSIKERIDKYAIQNQYGIDDDLITILDQEYDVQDGYAADSLEMVKVEMRADTSDMTLASNYKYITDRIDIENYIDYMGSEIFLSNEDWVYSNVVLWKKTGGVDTTKDPGYDGKFRWLFYDFDGAFGGSCNNAYYTVNTLEAATISTGIFATYSRLFRGLLENPEFKNRFINRTCDLMNSSFKREVLDEKMDQIKAELDIEMMENIDRWRYPSIATTLADRDLETPSIIQWDTTFYYLHRFADRRQRKVREHIMNKWGYPDTSKVTIDVNDQTMGSVKMNTLLINEQLAGVEAGIYPWSGMYIDSVSCQLVAVPMPGFEFVEWLESGETNDTTVWIPNGDTTITAIFQAATDFLPVVINEVMPSNSAYLRDNYGDYDDWTELYNPNGYPINLSNWSIKRDTNTWIIPSGTVIDANGYVVIWNDNELYQGDNHTNFKLPNSTQTVYLYSPTDVLIDFLIYPNTTTDYSFGRYPNGSGTYSEFSYPTPNQNNDISGIEESISEENMLLAYPNPSSTVMRLNQLVSYNLYSLDGRLVQSDVNTDIVNVLNLSVGSYMLVTTTGKSVKILVQK
jgi:hypothetical protein